MKEKDLMEFMTEKYPQLKPSKGKMCRYDMISEKALVELKCRYIKKDYGDSQIEKLKFDKNIELSQGMDKDFYYVVYSQFHNKVYAWNVTKLLKEDYDFGWCTKRCPATTSFENRTYIDKEVGGLRWGDAHAVWSV